MSRAFLRAAAFAALSTSFCYAGTANETGVNVNYLNDSDNTPLLADVMRTYRYVNAPGSNYNANNVALDANGWATSDAWYFLGDSSYIAHGDGTYALKFSGQATVTLGASAGSRGTVTNQTYDPATNTTTALLVAKTGVDLTDVRFSNTKRDAVSATNTGVTNIQIMRPTTPGGSTPLPFSATFTNQAKAIAGKTNVLRFMDYLATNNNMNAAVWKDVNAPDYSIKTEWADRTNANQVKLNPDMYKSSRGKGGPLELAVALGNESGKDIWVNVPAGASQDYITKMAQTIKFGSDGVNPYTSAQANPKFAPLAANLKVYVEYSNETWNTASNFKQSDQIAYLAQQAYNAEVASGTPGPLSYSPTGNKWYLTQRYNALMTKNIAETFGGVFGDGSLLNTVRPILAWQYGNGNDSANQNTLVLDGYFNNVKGNFVANPKGLNTYIYGGGSAMYYSPTDKSSVDAIVTTGKDQTDARFKQIQTDIAYTTTFGMKRVAYEGGLSLDPGTATETNLANKLAALADARMKQVVISQHNRWTNAGGDLLVYYFATDQYKFAMSDENYSTNTPKLQGLDELASTAATHAWTVGTPLSRTSVTTIRGKKFSLRDTSGTASDAAQDLSAGNWTSYLINITEGGNYQLVAHYKTSGTAAAFKLLLGGGLLADFTNLKSDAGYAATQSLLLNLPEGVTSLRVLASQGSGTFSLNDVTFTPVGGTTAIPEPASLAVLCGGSLMLLRRKRR